MGRLNQVSLRGASAKEITRDALLEKVSQERELRNYMRRATAAALFVQVDCFCKNLAKGFFWPNLYVHIIVESIWITFNTAV